MTDGGKTERQLHEDAGTWFPFGDPVDIVKAADEQRLLLQTFEDDGSFPWVCKFSTGWATSHELRVLANELDNRNGIPVQSEAADEDGTYSIRGLSRNQLLAVTQLVGQSSGEALLGADLLVSCVTALGYEDSLEGILDAKEECDAEFPDFSVVANFNG